MATFKWTQPETIATALSTELNSLANGSFAISSAIDNENGLYLFIDLELYLASFTPGSGSPYCAAYFTYSLDGTNFEKEPDGSSGDKPPDAIFPLEASVTQSSRIVITNIPIPPLKFKISLRNMSGAALASSGNTLKYRRHNEQGV
ncbi:MAG: hypothetical protein ABIL39_11500 [candidate division WOR-3 bacterium]